ncbi:Protein fam72a [Mortierella sp. AD094]|nr:Protein fam72a [Mortierella sp. AD094]
MPGSHPSNSPRAGSNAMDRITLENEPHQHPQHGQSYQTRGQQSLPHESHGTIDDGNEMLVDPYLSGLSSPGGSSTNTSGRNSVDHSIRGSASRDSTTDISLAARFSELVRSTRRDASSERPVIETYIDNEDYQSLLAAVSNIRVSQARSAADEARLGADQQLTYSPIMIQEDRDGSAQWTLGMQRDEDACNSHSSSSVGHIYDLQHIIVHNQRQLENQMLRARQEYARQIETPTTTPNSSSTHRTLVSEGATSGGIEGLMRQPFQEPYQASFDPRPTISSSYFSSTTESTIVLSSPPPGRSLNIFPYHANNNSNTTPSAPTPSSHNANRSVISQRHSSGPYRPFVTGRDLALQQQLQQEIQQETEQRPQRSHQRNVRISTNSTRETSSAVTDDDDGRVAARENNAGHWSMYGSPAQRTRSLDQHLNQHYHRQQQQATASITERPTMEDIIIESPVPPRPFAPLIAPRPNTSLPQSTADYNRRNQHASGSLPYPGSSIPIPRDTSTHTRGPRQPNSSDPTYRHYETAEQAASRSRHNAGLKEVVRMACRFCEAIICERGMKAQLLADQSVALLSTDDAPHSVQLAGSDYRPTNCMCKINDTACLVCGNAIGYHIAQPCEKCLSSDNNGHLWLFHPEYVQSMPRWNHKSSRPLRWSELPEPDQDFDTPSLRKVHQGGPGGRLIVGGMVRREYDAIYR